jgi:hypothetical protein
MCPLPAPRYHRPRDVDAAIVSQKNTFNCIIDLAPPARVLCRRHTTTGRAMSMPQLFLKKILSIALSTSSGAMLA